MHLTRQQSSKKLPIKRKGTKYIVRSKGNPSESVPILIAVRDILHLAKTKAEVKKLIHTKLLKLNGRLVRDYKESIGLFNILEADKPYRLSILPTGKFYLEELKDSKSRLCKVVNKILIGKNKIQLNLHDGSNIISDKQIKVNDSVYVDFSGKLVKHVSLDKGANVLIISGAYSGMKAKVQSIKDNKANVDLENNKKVELDLKRMVAI